MGKNLDKSAVLDRIKEYYSLRGNADLARFLGVAPNTITNWYNRLTFDIDAIYTKCEGVDFNWLLTGITSCSQKEKEKEIFPEANYECKGAPYYNVDFIGGFDLVLNDQSRNPDYYINFPPYNKEGVVWCNITGHSMEPELNNGDFIAMKEMYSPIEYLPAGEIYGIITDDYRTIKRIRMSEREGFVRLIPTNKSPEYAEQEIPVDMIRKIYAVLGSIHTLF